MHGGYFPGVEPSQVGRGTDQSRPNRVPGRAEKIDLASRAGRVGRATKGRVGELFHRSFSAMLHQHLSEVNLDHTRAILHMTLRRPSRTHTTDGLGSAEVEQGSKGSLGTFR